MGKLSLGIDCGSTTVKGVLFDGEKVIDSRLVATSARPALRMHEVYEKLWNEDVGYVVTTGYGRELLPEVNKKVTEITCHAKGAHFLGGNVGGVIDIGGQDSKAILLDKDGNVADFLMNDKCAAGTGRFIEMMCRILECTGDELDTFSPKGPTVDITSMCTVFAESEVISLIGRGEPKENIAYAVVDSIVKKVASQAGRLALGKTVCLTGGLCEFDYLCESLSKKLNVTVNTNPDGRYAGAIGAALSAMNIRK